MGTRTRTGMVSRPQKRRVWSRQVRQEGREGGERGTKTTTHRSCIAHALLHSAGIDVCRVAVGRGTLLGGLRREGGFERQDHLILQNMTLHSFSQTCTYTHTHAHPHSITAQHAYRLNDIEASRYVQKGKVKRADEQRHGGGEGKLN